MEWRELDVDLVGVDDVVELGVLDDVVVVDGGVDVVVVVDGGGDPVDTTSCTELPGGTDVPTGGLVATT